MANLLGRTDLSYISPSRSRTDPPAPEMHHEKTHLHKRLHSGSLRSRTFASSGKDKPHHHLRHSAKETVQSAIELKPPISLDTLLRRDKKTPDSSRRGSGSQQIQQQQQPETTESRAQQAALAEQRRIKPEQVRKAKQDNEKRNEELRNSLKSVEQVAMRSTRQLDDTYYSILEKASILRSTVASLQQLAEESSKMHARFQEDTSQLEEDTRKSLKSWDDFNAQEKRIDELVGQLRSSKDKTDKLNDRLEAARNRVAAFEQQENEKQKASRQRWGVMWVVLISLVGILIALAVAKHRAEVGTRLHHVAQVWDKDFAQPIAAALKPATTPSEDPFLKKLFDDL